MPRGINSPYDHISGDVGIGGYIEPSRSPGLPWQSPGNIQEDLHPPGGETSQGAPWVARGYRSLGLGRHLAEIRVTGTARGAQLPFAVGTVRHAGQCFVWDVQGAYVYAAYVFSVFPAASLSDIEVDGVAIADSDAVADYDTHLGGGSQSAETDLTGNVDELSSAFPWLTYVYVKFHLDELTSWPQVVATGSYKGYEWVFGSWTETENPVYYLYAYLYAHPMGPQLDSATQHSSSWTASVSHCNETVNSLARWRVGGVLRPSTRQNVLRELLGSFFGLLSYVGGYWQLQTIASDTSASATIVAEEVLDRQVDWNQAPGMTRVHFTDKNNDYSSGSQVYRSDNPEAWSPVELSPPLINAADVAERYAEVYTKVQHDQSWEYTARVDPSVSEDVWDVVPGSVINLRERTWSAAVKVRVLEVEVSELYWELTCVVYSALESSAQGSGDTDPDVTVDGNTVGTAGTNVTATETTYGLQHRTVLNLDSIDDWTFSPGSVSSPGIGTSDLLYTFPAARVIVLAIQTDLTSEMTGEDVSAMGIAIGTDECTSPAETDEYFTVDEQDLVAEEVLTPSLTTQPEDVDIDSGGAAPILNASATVRLNRAIFDEDVVSPGDDTTNAINGTVRIVWMLAD